MALQLVRIRTALRFSGSRLRNARAVRCALCETTWNNERECKAVGSLQLRLLEAIFWLNRKGGHLFLRDRAGR